MTLYFQVQLSKLKCTENTKSIIKNALESERKKKPSSLKKSIKDQKEIYKKLGRDTEIQSQEDSIGKGNIRKILNKKKIILKRNIRKILHQKKNMKKRNTRKILN